MHLYDFFTLSNLIIHISWSLNAKCCEISDLWPLFNTRFYRVKAIFFNFSFREIFLDDHGCLFTLCEMPQPKPKGFFESFFSSTPSPLDREELCKFSTTMFFCFFVNKSNAFKNGLFLRTEDSCLLTILIVLTFVVENSLIACHDLFAQFDFDVASKSVKNSIEKVILLLLKVIH